MKAHDSLDVKFVNPMSEAVAQSEGEGEALQPLGEEKEEDEEQGEEGPPREWREESRVHDGLGHKVPQVEKALSQVSSECWSNQSSTVIELLMRLTVLPMAGALT